MIFKPISRAEFDAMTLDQRMTYLQRLMADLQRKVEDTRKQQAAVNAKLESPR